MDNTKLSLKSLFSGFTLVELIVIIGVVTVLATSLIVVLNPSEQIKKTNDTKRKRDLAQIQRALEVYYQDYGRYPASINGQLTRKVNGVDTASPWGQSWSPYMDVVPDDPNGNKDYMYVVSDDNQSYGIYASLDRNNDSQACFPGTNTQCTNANSTSLKCNAIASFNCNCGSVCNYGVTSSNRTP